MGYMSKSIGFHKSVFLFEDLHDCIALYNLKGTYGLRVLIQRRKPQACMFGPKTKMLRLHLSISNKHSCQSYKSKGCNQRLDVSACEGLSNQGCISASKCNFNREFKSLSPSNSASLLQMQLSIQQSRSSTE